MKYLLVIVSFLIPSMLHAQLSRDTTLGRCPVFITDTVSQNNYFIEARPAILKVYRVKGDLTVVVEQREQYLSLFFHEKSLRNTTYDIEPGSKSRGEVEATYSFKSGDQVAYINLSDGKIQSVFDKEQKVWKLKITGTITNMTDRSLTYYKVKADLILKK